MSEVSVLTLVRGRRDHLANLIRGLEAQTEAPRELVIAYMQPEPHRDLPPCSFPVVEAHIDSRALPLAAARNLAARHASGAHLVFLDVDCVASPTLVERYARALETVYGVIMGEVYYLPEHHGSLPCDGSTLDYAWLDAVGYPHPAKPSFPTRGLEIVSEHGELWGLSFAIARDLYLACGGMDERFVGYGAEETDFAATLEARGAPLYRLAGARCYHQHHDAYRPPLQHFDSIIRNATLFHRKWGRWCMTYWLDLLADAHYIERQDREIVVLRHPTARDVEAARLDASHRF